jgi:hypothetical protein
MATPYPTDQAAVDHRITLAWKLQQRWGESATPLTQLHGIFVKDLTKSVLELLTTFLTVVI